MLWALAAHLPAQTQSSATSYYWSPLPINFGGFYLAQGLARDTDGNLYFSSSQYHNLFKVSAAGIVTVLAGPSAGEFGYANGTGSEARFYWPQGLAVDSTGIVYMAEYGNPTVRRISPSGVVTTLAGIAGAPGFNDGAVSVARLGSPRGVAVDGTGNVYVTDSSVSRIRMISVSGVVTTIAGEIDGSADGVGTIARFSYPWGIVFDRAGNLFVTDAGAQTVRKITPGRVVTTIAGTPFVAGSADGPVATARFNSPTGVAVDNGGNLFVTDTQNHTIRRIAPDGQVTTIGGHADGKSGSLSGIGGAATFYLPFGVVVDDKTGILYVAHGYGIQRGEPTKAPVITAQPQSLAVLQNQSATLTVSATGVPSPSYQWRLNGGLVPGATSSTLFIAGAQAQNEGDYTVTVSNGIGSVVTSAVARLSVNFPPSISVQPQSTILGPDGTAQLSVSASGTGNLTYQWIHEGRPIAGATDATLRTATYGRYTVVVTNAYSVLASTTVLVDFPNRVVNLSARGSVAGGTGALVAGVTVTAPPGETKTLLIRGIGPALTQFGVPGAVARTVITLKDARGTTLASNQGWSTSPNLGGLLGAVDLGAFPLQPGSGDSGLYVQLSQGNYTVAVEPAAGAAPGAGMVEVYETLADGTRLTNLSTRGQVADAGGMTVGFVARGVVAPNLLVRAIGPGLTQFGVAGALARPVLTVFSGTTPIATNAGWTNAANATQIEDAARAVGAFALARSANDSAALLTLTPGRNYTAQVTAADGANGVALVEIYQVP